MSIEKVSKFGWLSLPPLPNGFTTANLYSANSADGRMLFVSDGVRGIFFDSKYLIWGIPFAFPYANNNTQITGINSKGYFALYNANIPGRIALCTFYGVHYAPGYNVDNMASSTFGQGYVGGGWANIGCIFDLIGSIAHFNDYYFMVFSEIYGTVSYIVVGFSIYTGQPLIQWNAPQLPITGVFRGSVLRGAVYTQTPYSLLGVLSNGQTGISDYQIITPQQYALWLVGANSVGNIDELATVWFSPINNPVPDNAGILSCPSYNAGNYTAQPIDNQNPVGFGKVLGEMAGTIITDNYYVQLNGTELTYVNLTPSITEYSEAQSKYIFWNNGIFNAAIGLQTPLQNGSNINPSMGSYNGDGVAYPPTMVNYANTYGFFKPDFSAGWVLGIANYELMSYNMNNYTRSRR